MSADRRQTDTGLERGPRARRPVRFYFVREDGRTYIQLGWAASDAFSRSSRSQGSNRGHMTLQSSVNIARDPVSLHRTVGACACGSLALVLYSLLSVAGPLTLPHRSAAGPSPSLSHREISLHSTPTSTTPLLHYRYRFVTFDSSTVTIQWTRYPATRRIIVDCQYFIVKITKKLLKKVTIHFLILPLQHLCAKQRFSNFIATHGVILNTFNILYLYTG